MKKPRTVTVSCLILAALAGLATGCMSVHERQEAYHNISYFIEYLVRGDVRSAGTMLKQETDSGYAEAYRLFLPKRRSLDDEKHYFPVFLENRIERFPRIREYKRAGLIGESANGTLSIVPSNPAAREEPMRSVLKKLIFRENFDRQRVVRYIVENTRSISKRELAAGFAFVRHKMALTGDMIQIAENDGAAEWREAERE